MHDMNKYILAHIDLKKYPELKDYVHDVVEQDHCYSGHVEWFEEHRVVDNPELKEYLMNLLDDATAEVEGSYAHWLWGRLIFKEIIGKEEMDYNEDSIDAYFRRKENGNLQEKCTAPGE